MALTEPGLNPLSNHRSRYDIRPAVFIQVKNLHCPVALGIFGQRYFCAVSGGLGLYLAAAFQIGLRTADTDKVSPAIALKQASSPAVGSDKNIQVAVPIQIPGAQTVKAALLKGPSGGPITNAVAQPNAQGAVSSPARPDKIQVAVAVEIHRHDIMMLKWLINYNMH